MAKFTYKENCLSVSFKISASSNFEGKVISKKESLLQMPSKIQESLRAQDLNDQIISILSVAPLYANQYDHIILET